MLLGALGRIARHGRATLVSPPFVGAAYVAGLVAWSGTRTSGMDVGDVTRAEAVEVLMARHFCTEVRRMEIGVIAAAIALGVVLGLVAEVLLRVRYTKARLLRRSVLGVLTESTLLVAGLHATLVGWAMADSPQLYAERWYARGGLGRTVQVMATDVLGPRGVVLGTLTLAVLYMRPTCIASFFRCAMTLARRPLHGVVASLAARSMGPMVLLVVGAAAFSDRRWLASVAHVAAPSGAAGTPPVVVTGGAPTPVNVLILAAGSLRADRLDERVAPNLTKLASRGTRFDRAYVSLPRALPSWVTILTGRHGHHHGIRSTFPRWEERAKDFDALPSRFATAGYRTGVVSDAAGDIFGRIDLGFERVDAPAFDFQQVIRQRILERQTPLLPVLHSHPGRRVFPAMRELSAAEPMFLADDVEAALRSMKDGPFFMTVFFSTTHLPYAAPSPYYARYTSKSYRGRFKYRGPTGLGPAVDVPPDAEDIRQIEALYDGAVRGVDHAIGRVVDTLERLDLADRTIVVVTADHGETIFENGRGNGHGDHLFGDEGTHVPLVIVDPTMASDGREKGRREGHLVRDVDLAPTLYELAGVAPPSDLDGRSLVPALRGELLEPRLAYAETELWSTEEVPGLSRELRMPYPGLMGLTELEPGHDNELVLRKEMQAVTLMAKHRMVRDERWKLIYVPTRAGVRYVLFDTANDPAELHDVAGAHPDEVLRLRAELWRWMLKDPAMEQKSGYLVPRGSR